MAFKKAFKKASIGFKETVDRQSTQIQREITKIGVAEQSSSLDERSRQKKSFYVEIEALRELERKRKITEQKTKTMTTQIESV